jgi:hypothetical protein
MTRRLKVLTAAGALCLCMNVPAFAGSVTQPGETVGIATAVPLPPGFYFVNTADYGCRNSNPNVCVGVDIPVIAWSTPWQILGARLQFLVATPVVEVGTQDTGYVSGVYNPFLAGQLAWDLGNGFNFSYAFGAYFGVKSDVAFDSTSLNQRFGLAYVKDGWSAAANVIWGIHLDNSVTTTANPNFLNVDFSLTKTFGKWELGPVGYYSTDLNQVLPNIGKQQQVSVGGLVGYNFGPVITQVYVTTNVWEENYGGKDTRVWGRIIIPLGNPFQTAAVAPPYPTKGPALK